MLSIEEMGSEQDDVKHEQGQCQMKIFGLLYSF